MIEHNISSTRIFRPYKARFSQLIVSTDRQVRKQKLVHLENSVTIIKFDTDITNIISGSPKLLNVELLNNKKGLSIKIDIKDVIRDNNILVETEENIYEIVFDVVKQSDTAHFCQDANMKVTHCFGGSTC